MTDETFWNIFTYTCDPLCWLMSRAADKTSPPAENKDRAAEEPSAPAD